MITNGTAPAENYYRITFRNVGHEVYEYGATALEAVSTAIDDLLDEGWESLGASTVRPAVYKEWNNGTEHYTNGGDFIHDTSKPCRNCGTPVEFHTHREELGFCQPCSEKFWNLELDPCM